MTLSIVIAVAVALVFTYWLLAALASGAQEIIAAIFAWRGTYLSKGIDVILDNASDAKFKWSFAEFLKAHFTGGAPPTVAERLQQQVEQNQNGVWTPGQQVLHRVLSVQTHPLVRGTPPALPSYVASRNFAMALLEALRDGSPAPLFSQLEQTVSALPDGDLKKTLSLFVQAAGGDIDDFRVHVEHWFDDAMDRLSGIYKRLSQYVLIIFGVILAVALNVDSVRLARTMWMENGLRAAVLADAVAAANKPSEAQTGKAAASGQPGGQAQPAAEAQPAAGKTKRLQSTIASVREEIQSLENENLPIGWTKDRRLKGSPGAVIAHIFGWLITALAIALGAPFWFSLLQQLTNIRNAGPVPKRANNAAA